MNLDLKLTLRFLAGGGGQSNLAKCVFLPYEMSVHYCKTNKGLFGMLN